MKNWKQLATVILALLLCACGPVQCAIGERVNQSVTYHNSGLLLIAIITVAGVLALCVIYVIGGPMGPPPRQ